MGTCQAPNCSLRLVLLRLSCSLLRFALCFFGYNVILWANIFSFGFVYASSLLVFSLPLSNSLSLSLLVSLFHTMFALLPSLSHSLSLSFAFFRCPQLLLAFSLLLLYFARFSNPFWNCFFFFISYAENKLYKNLYSLYSLTTISFSVVYCMYVCMCTAHTHTLAHAHTHVCHCCCCCCCYCCNCCWFKSFVLKKIVTYFWQMYV